MAFKFKQTKSIKTLGTAEEQEPALILKGRGNKGTGDTRLSQETTSDQDTSDNLLIIQDPTPTGGGIPKKESTAKISTTTKKPGDVPLQTEINKYSYADLGDDLRKPKGKAQGGVVEVGSEGQGESAPLQGFKPTVLAVINQKKSDFDTSHLAGTNVYNSKLLCANEVAMVEDRISRAVIADIFNTALLTDANFFAAAQEVIDVNIESADNIISILNQIFNRIRNFDDSFYTLFSNPLQLGGSTYFTSRGLAKIKQGGGDQDPLLAVDSAFDSPLDLVRNIKYFSGKKASLNNNIFDQKTNTAILASSLGLTQFFIGNNFFPTSDVGGLAYLKHWDTQTSILEKPNTIVQFQSNLSLENFSSKDFMRRNFSGVNDAGETSATENVIFLDDMLDEIYLNLANKPSENGRIQLNLQLFCNEIINSSGVKRLIGTEIGAQFSVSSVNSMRTNAINLLGVSSEKTTAEISYPGSVADFLLVDALTGNSQTQEGANTLPFEGSKVDLSDVSDVIDFTRTPTDPYAYSVFTNPTNNIFGTYQQIIRSAKSNVDAAMEYYKILQCRDKQLNLLNPRALFAKILKTIAESLEISVINTDTVDQYQLAELALYFTAAKKESGFAPGSVNTLRRSLCTALARSIYRKLQPGVKVSQKFSDPLFDITTEVTDVSGNGDTTVTRVKATDNTGASQVNNENLNKIKLSDGNDLQNFGTSGGLYERYTLTSFGIGKAPTNDVPVVFGSDTQLYTPEVLEIWRATETNDSMLTNKLAQIFVDVHLEAEANLQDIISTETSTFIDSSRKSVANNLLGNSLIILLYDTVETIFKKISKANWPSIGSVTFGEGDDLEQFEDLNLLNLAAENNDTTDLLIDALEGELQNYSPRLAITNIPTDGASTRDPLVKALKLVAEASENNSFDSVYNSQGKVAALDLFPNDSIGDSEVSFQDLQDLVEELAMIQDLPYASLTAHSVVIDRIIANSEALSILSQNLRDANTLAFANFKNFADSNVGSNYLSNGLTDRTLKMSQVRLNKIKAQNLEPTKKIERITPGELACIKVVFEKLVSMGSAGKQTIFFPIFGITPGQVKNNLLGNFSLLDGFESNPDFLSMKVNVRRTSWFQNIGQGLEYPQVTNTYGFMVGEIINFNSFKNFELENLALDLDTILNQVQLSTGQTGKQFMDLNSSGSPFLKGILKNEVISYLCRKAFSVVSPLDLFSEDIGVYQAFAAKDATASNLAANMATLLGYPENIFNNIFIGPLPGADYSLMSKSNFFNGESPPALLLNFAQLEFIADLFSTLYFDGTLTFEKTFSPVVYEKIFCIPMVESTISVFDFNEYETTILPGSIFKSIF